MELIRSNTVSRNTPLTASKNNQIVPYVAPVPTAQQCPPRVIDVGTPLPFYGISDVSQVTAVPNVQRANVLPPACDINAAICYGAQPPAYGNYVTMGASAPPLVQETLMDDISHSLLEPQS